MTQAEYYDRDLRYLSESGKRENMAVSLVTSAVKHGVKVLNETRKMNLIGRGVAIAVGGYEDEKVICPDQGDKLITRAKCLDYSGSHETCRTCDHDKVTKSLLLGK